MTFATGRNLLAAPLLAVLLAAGPAQALVVNSLPYEGSPDWSTNIWSGTGIALVQGASPPRSELQTAWGSTGVWFGYGYAGINRVPAWAPSGNAIGNQLSLTLSFNTAARDLNAYLYDGSGHAAGFSFLPTACAPYCASPSESAVASVSMVFGTTGTSYRYEVVSGLDMTQPHQFDLLLKGTQVSYRIDGRVYAGPAWWSNNGNQLLLIGDTSAGYSSSGFGTMTIHAVSFNTAPGIDVLSPVPEPSQALLLLLGLGALAGRWFQSARRH